MNRKSFVIRSLGVVATLAAVTLSSMNARAEIVFGNLPATGMAVWSDSSTDCFPTSNSHSSLAHGFTSGPVSLTAESIILGMSGASATNAVSVHSNVGNAPHELLLQPNAIHSSGQNRLFFDFKATFLPPNTNPWGVSEQASSGYPTIDTPQPAGLIGSGNAALGMVRQENGNPGTPAISSQPSSISVEPVPQQSSPVMAGLGVGGIAMLARRRCRRQAR
jgi:hypothetical protein